MVTCIGQYNTLIASICYTFECLCCLLTESNIISAELCANWEMGLRLYRFCNPVGGGRGGGARAILHTYFIPRGAWELDFFF